MNYNITYNNEIIDINIINQALLKNEDWRHLYIKYKKFLKQYIEIIDSTCDVDTFYEKYCIDYSVTNGEYYHIFEYKPNTLFATCVQRVGTVVDTFGVTIDDNGEIIYYNDNFYKLRGF